MPMAELPPTPRRHLVQSLARFERLGLHANRDSPEPEEGFNPIRRKQNPHSIYDETKWPNLDYSDMKSISKTRAKSKFLLTDGDLKDLCWERGPIYKHEHSHKYLCTELRHRAWQKHGGPAGLQFALKENTKKKKQKKVAAAAANQAAPRRRVAGRAPNTPLGRRPGPGPSQLQPRSSPGDDLASSDSESDDEALEEFQLPSPPTSPVPVTPRRGGATSELRGVQPSTPSSSRAPHRAQETRVSRQVDIDLTLTDEGEVVDPYPTPSRRRTGSQPNHRGSSTMPRNLKFLGYVDSGTFTPTFTPTSKPREPTISRVINRSDGKRSESQTMAAAEQAQPLPRPPPRHLATSLAHFQALKIRANYDKPELQGGFKPIRLMPNIHSNYDESTWHPIDYGRKDQMSKKEATVHYVLTPNDLRDLCWEKGEFYKYQHYHNYLCSELLRRAFEKHGGPSGLQFARVKARERMKAKAAAAAKIASNSRRRPAASSV
ncbi:hypothetical protein CVT26_015600 [Gymnopilus dilepis]|uniref:Uncharacterized protein n=1 Tax=Gymnopilus dilepis TaxID=231916 RepID=A0A409XYR7_9AGAR|nr:hypothetical protein CVT26_015600 [Gymnopilus dilepis]